VKASVSVAPATAKVPTTLTWSSQTRFPPELNSTTPIVAPPAPNTTVGRLTYLTARPLTVSAGITPPVAV